MNILSREKQCQIIGALVEGASIRSTSRMTGAAKGTILKLLLKVGRACQAYQDKAFRNLPCKLIQCDEIWAFCYAKHKNVPRHLRNQFGYGDVWTWVALDADTKLIISWLVSPRSRPACQAFIQDLSQRLSNRVQITTDGFGAYREAIEVTFGSQVDYGVSMKTFGEDIDPNDVKFSPYHCTKIDKLIMTGKPRGDDISTSYVERQNLTMRLGMRRMTRLTNGFSRKIINLKAAVALHFMNYNFCRIHASLKVTPAMAAGLAMKPMTINDIVAMVKRI